MMGILNPIAANFNVPTGTTQLVYSCPVGKSHAILDLTFYRDNIAIDALVQVGISTAPAASLTSIDFFLDDLAIILANKNVELTKVVVGSGENLYIKVLTGNVTVRVTGMEEFNTKVSKGGRLSAGNMPVASTLTKIVSTAVVGVAYISTSVSLFNKHATLPANIMLYVTNAATPGINDKIIDTTVLANDTIVVDNLMLMANESIYVISDQINTEYFSNGFIVLA